MIVSLMRITDIYRNKQPFSRESSDLSDSKTIIM